MAVGVVIVVALLAVAALRLLLNQSRFTHHGISRIQAQYAAQAGINLAYDRLSQNDPDDPFWPDPPKLLRGYVRHICGRSGGPCNPAAGDIRDDSFPYSVNIYVTSRNQRRAAGYTPSGDRCNPPGIPPDAVDICIDARVDYSYP